MDDVLCSWIVEVEHNLRRPNRTMAYSAYVVFRAPVRAPAHAIP